MKNLKTLAATLLISGMFAVPAFADSGADHDTFITFMHGGVMHMTMKSSAMIDEAIKSGTLIDNKSIIIMHDGKTYLVKDMKMSDGHMLYDYATGERSK